MTNFSLKPGMVRGDLFLPSGKWKYTVQIDMTDCWYDLDLHDAVRIAYQQTPEKIRGVRDNATGFYLVVLEPFHKNAYPVSIRI